MEDREREGVMRIITERLFVVNVAEEIVINSKLLSSVY